MHHTLKQLKSGQLNGVSRLKIEENLKEFPSEIFSLSESLEILDLTNNQLNYLPNDFSKLEHLKILFLSSNSFTTLPEVLSQCPNLEMIGFKSNLIKEVSKKSLPPRTRWLILTDNKIENLPNNIGDLKRLQKLMLAGNCLKELPDSLANCKELELIRISANRLKVFPKSLFSLPKLAWLAFSSNPFTNTAQQLKKNVLRLPLKDLLLKNILGQGASGTTYQAEWKKNSHNLPMEVAVKIYKKGITSDGYALDELKACLALGKHNNLTNILGIAEEDNRQALIMELIPDSFRVLASPPSFESCTRDVFQKNFILPLEIIKTIIDQMLDITAYFKENEIYHGDLYAHNVLYNQDGKIIMSDFGAAGSYSMLNDKEKQRIKDIEKRALGIFFKDLLAVCDPKSIKTNEFYNILNLTKIYTLSI